MAKEAEMNPFETMTNARFSLIIVSEQCQKIIQMLLALKYLSDIARPSNLFLSYLILFCISHRLKS